MIEKATTALDAGAETVALIPSVQLHRDGQGRMLLMHPATGRYLRMGPSGAAFLAALDGRHTPEALLDTLAARYAVPREQLQPRLRTLLQELSDLGLLVGSSPKAPTGRRWLAGLARIPKARLVLVRRPDRLLDPMARSLRRLPPGLLASGLTVTAACSATVGLLLLYRLGPVNPAPHILMVMAAMLVLTLTHELSHALACRILDVHVREIGVALWYYVLPVFYVDHTDMWQRDGRAGRVMISLAGPLHDLFAVGVTAASMALTPASWQPALHSLLFFQASMLLVHLNPFLPMDGLQAVEAGFGHANLRGRSVASLTSLLLRTELPTSLAVLRRWQRLLYASYGLLCLLYVPLLGYAMFSWLRLLGRLLGWLA